MTVPVTEFTLRANMLESELLSRYTVGSLAAIDARQLETFRVGAGIHVTDPSWKLLVEKWRAAGPDKDVNVSELETWTETNLHDLMIREEAKRSIREDAALELYRRGSKFVRTPEFATFLTMCIDRELVERKATHEPTRVLDALWRINQKAETYKSGLTQIDATHTEAEAHLQAALAMAVETLRAEVEARGEILHQAIATVRKTVKKHASFLGSTTFLTALALVLHLFHVV